MKKKTIVFLELGMLAGIILSMYTLPGTTPLRTFLIASGMGFAVGNLFIIKTMVGPRKVVDRSQTTSWPHFLRVFGILAGAWLISFLIGHF
jgi:hypothetical protein